MSLFLLLLPKHIPQLKFAKGFSRLVTKKYSKKIPLHCCNSFPNTGRVKALCKCVLQSMNP